MVSFNTFSVFTLASLLPAMVAGECKDPATGASITIGAWNMNGVNGTWRPARYDANNINAHNPSWTIPDETWSYQHGEMSDSGPNYYTQFTCSKLTFCNPEDIPDDGAEEAGGRKLIDAFSQQDIWKMTSKETFDNCDFTGAELIGTTSATTCVEVEKDDLVMEGEKSYYASKENCAAGQKLAVMISDYESFASQCAAIAGHTPASARLRGCDCDYNKKPFAVRYPTLCATAFQEKCMDLMMPGECCDTETCFSKVEVFETVEGKEHELLRRSDCNDDIPGNCYNQDGTATDMSVSGSTDCCYQTCSSCGSELASAASWETCTANTPADMTAKCGRLSRYSLEDFICDFSKCPEDSHWGSKNNAVWKYMGKMKPSDLTVPGDGVIDLVEPSAQSSTSGGSSVSMALGALLAGIVAALL